MRIIAALPEAPVIPAVDWRQLALPEELRGGFAAAVKIQSITQLNKRIDAGATRRPEPATHLRGVARKFEIPAMREILAELGVDIVTG